MRNRSNKLVKIMSLGIGLAISIVLIAKVCFELSYDNFYEDIDNIYEIRTGFTQQSEEMDIYNISGAVVPGFRDEVPGVIDATVFSYPFGFNNKFTDENNNALTVKGDFMATDNSFFNVFEREILIGNINDVVSSWNGNIAINNSFAEKLGGTEKALGKVLKNDAYPNIKLTVAAVFEDFPENSTYNIKTI